MADQKHLDILAKGVGAWNEWRTTNGLTIPSLNEADFTTIKHPLEDLDLTRANLFRARLSRTTLIRARMFQADLRSADLRQTDLRMANLSLADLRGANLAGANVEGADLVGANLSGADLTDTRLAGAIVWGTVFGTVDLSTTIGLDRLEHSGPSIIDMNTIHRSPGRIPDSFLRGAGVPDDFIEYMKSLTPSAFDFYSVFISYASADHAFAERLRTDLQAEGVLCWFAPEDLKIGDKFRSQIDKSILAHDKLLLVLSEHSIRSPWVEKEVEAAFERERREKRIVLFPIRLDDAVMETDEAWAADIRRTRHIGDFTGWEQQAKYKKAFERLLRDLKAQPGDKATVQPAS
jgi:TIR domain/Pentapeptide repeats (8 copies)